MNVDLEREMAATRARVDARLVALLTGGPSTLRAAMQHAALGAGKRLRPILCLWTHEMMGAPRPEAALDTAAAIELVHAYSLVHDDLPCMDDDALRRGRPTCHVVYGEAAAVLAGDALLNLAYETLAAAPWDDAAIGLAVTRTIAAAASHRGLVGGQMLDLEAEGVEPTRERLEAIHAAKTGALIGAALVAGGLAAGCGPEAATRLGRIGADLGLAFQITDDVLDVVGGAAELGKSPGKDAGSHKMTYPALVGLDRSRELAERSARAAEAGLARWPGSARLQALALYCVRRGR